MAAVRGSLPVEEGQVSERVASWDDVRMIVMILGNEAERR